MLKQASVEDLRKKCCSPGGHVVVAMHSFPRGLKKSLFDEYISSLSPGPPLFKDFYHHKRDKKEEHNSAFAACGYERRFGVPSEGLAELKRLADLSAKKDVYLVCQCKENEKCHRELLQMMAEKWYGATIAPLRFEYDLFAKRLLKKPPENLSFAEATSRKSRGLEWPLPLRE